MTDQQPANVIGSCAATWPGWATIFAGVVGVLLQASVARGVAAYVGLVGHPLAPSEARWAIRVVGAPTALLILTILLICAAVMLLRGSARARLAILIAGPIVALGCLLEAITPMPLLPDSRWMTALTVLGVHGALFDVLATASANVLSLLVGVTLIVAVAGLARRKAGVPTPRRH